MDRRWLLGGALLAGGFGFVRILTYRPKLEASSRVLVIGDSLAQGMLPHFKALAEESGHAFIGAGIVGSRTGQWANSDWLLSKLQEFKPTHVLISLGTNDAYGTTDSTAAQKALLDRIKGSGAHPIWIGAPALPQTYGTRTLNPAILEALRSGAPYYFDSTQYVIPRGPDGLHPSAGGYAGWAGAIWNWLT